MGRYTKIVAMDQSQGYLRAYQLYLWWNSDFVFDALHSCTPATTMKHIKYDVGISSKVEDTPKFCLNQKKYGVMKLWTNFSQKCFFYPSTFLWNNTVTYFIFNTIMNLSLDKKKCKSPLFKNLYYAQLYIIFIIFELAQIQWSQLHFTPTRLKYRGNTYITYHKYDEGDTFSSHGLFQISYNLHQIVWNLNSVFILCFD